ncbi:MAG: dienelactone hydrolase family protein [Marinicaulis sp.]|nr:dienelactone hydrolase family protein [Marinicaulis sp.]
MTKYAPRKTAADFDPAILDLFDGYVHGAITKRDFLERAAKYTAGAAGALAVLNALKPDYALAHQVAEDDPAIESEWIEYKSKKGHGTIRGLTAWPAPKDDFDGPYGAVLVIHENRGLNPYVEDVARRIAKAGFLALAPDGLSPKGGYPGNDDVGRSMQRELDRTKLLEDFFAGFEHIAQHKKSNGKAGAVGFCFGGGVCNALAVAYPEMACSVPFYGRQASAEDVPAINAALLLHYGGNDKRVNAGWPDYEAALEEHDKTYQAHFYPGASHGFHNDSTPRYDQKAANLAWARTLEWFERYLM